MTKLKIFRLLCQSAVCYAVLCAVLGLFQRSLIYYPSRESQAALLAQARALRSEPWRDAGGVLIGWKAARSTGLAPANRLVVFQWNAGYALDRTHDFSGFETLDGGRTWEVLLFEYPGYRARPGSLAEDSFIAAGLQALEALTAEDTRPVYLLGESLGRGLASALAGRVPERVAGIFLVTPFASFSGVAQHHYPFLPTNLLLRDRWDNTTVLRGYCGAIAVLIAMGDEVVTAAQGRLLFDGYAGPKRLWIEDDARHNTIDLSPAAGRWREISNFLLEHASARLSPP